MKNNKMGLCCISLILKESGYSFQRMTYKRFSSLERTEALIILGNRILNNMIVTNKIIDFCSNHNMNYRLSSDLFPLITYDKANIDLTDLPNYDEIQDEFDNIAKTIATKDVRISLHPSEYNSLASTSENVVEKTITELNFYSSFMDRIGCEQNYNSPINIHIHNKDGSNTDIISRFMRNFDRLDDSCKRRLVIENDDKVNCWSVKQLIDDFYPRTNIPITFDYLHHSCHPEFMTEREALEECYMTWGDHKPLFHYSESREGKNPRAHADYAELPFNMYGLDFDVDMELKMKDKAIFKHRKEHYERSINESSRHTKVCEVSSI